jgi:hypothetical protein
MEEGGTFSPSGCLIYTLICVNATCPFHILMLNATMRVRDELWHGSDYDIF